MLLEMLDANDKTQKPATGSCYALDSWTTQTTGEERKGRYDYSCNRFPSVSNNSILDNGSSFLTGPNAFFKHLRASGYCVADSRT